MNRDGYRESVWQQRMRTYHSQGKSVLQDLTYDVAIVGAGLSGLSTAVKLQESGLKCIVIEAHEVGFGTSGGTTAHINTFLDTPYTDIAKNFSDKEAGLVAQAVQDAINLISNNVNKYKIDCDFSMQPGYIFSKTDEQTELLEKIVAYCQKIGVKAEFTAGVGLTIPYQRIAEFKGQAQFHPLKYIYGLAAIFEKKGGIIVQGCRMEKADKKETCIIETNLGTIESKQLIYATHTPPGVNVLHTLIAPYRSYVIAVDVEFDDLIPGLLYDMDEPYHYYRTYQEGKRNLLIIGGEDHKTGEVESERPFLALEAHASTHFPDSSVVYKWSSQYYEPSDGLAYIGEFPGSKDDIFVATGFGGNGMIYGSIAAIILHDIVTQGVSRYGSLFSPKRIKPLAAFSNFVAGNASVVKELLTGRLSVDKLQAFADLAPDEGRLIEYDGKKMGVYKDPSGNIFAVDPICPHLKCTVEWNTTERSWDCPCHGSRFSFAGELLTGPAKVNLTTYNLQKKASL